jgi:hypothetical protein
MKATKAMAAMTAAMTDRSSTPSTQARAIRQGA